MFGTLSAQYRLRAPLTPLYLMSAWVIRNAKSLGIDAVSMWCSWEVDVSNELCMQNQEFAIDTMMCSGFISKPCVCKSTHSSDHSRDMVAGVCLKSAIRRVLYVTMRDGSDVETV